MTIEQEMLVTDHLHIARSKAGKWTRSQNILSYDELLSTAYMALTKAAIAYDPSRGCHFVGFASTCIDNEIRNEMRKGINCKQHSSGDDVESVIEELNGAEVEDILALRQALEKLPDKEKELLRRYMADGMNQRKLGGEYGVSQFVIFEQLKEIYEFLRYQINV